MKIIEIEASNFRTLENFHLHLKSNYCTISGKNNAGKSAIVKIIQHFFDDRDEDSFYRPYSNRITFAKDKTQWSSAQEMKISVSVELDRVDDSEVFFVVETYNENKIESDKLCISLCQIFDNGEQVSITCKINGRELDGRGASEILKKFRSASNLVVHNSTNPKRGFFYLGEDYTEVLEAHFSQEDRRKISEAAKSLQSKIKQAAKQHKEELGKLLGKLNDSYKVELTTVESGKASKFPLQIKLTDRSVEVPLTDWGAGTQNRTRVLMSVLDAVRMRSSVTDEDRSTPVFIVEEPESFLHPSAQAEFGQVLNGLAEELKIQIIATTHSPYLLNQAEPSANILLERKISRNLLRETHILDTSGDEWMLPFAENLGVIPSEFNSWKSVFKSQSTKVILVEGDLDKQYFDFFKSKYPKMYKIPSDVEIIPYGGKDALKNTLILQFMIGKFGKTFITFDMDAEGEVRNSLERIGLETGRDFCAIGNSGAGYDCIEGLLPSVIKQKVYARQHDHVTALTSQDTKARNKAKSILKQALLDEFKSSDVDDKELGGFAKLFSSISKAFA